MPDNRSQAPVEPRPTLLLCCAILSVIAILSVVATIILTALDANGVPDLPDPLVNNVGDLAASSSVVTVVLLGIHLLRRAGSRNTAAVMARLDARHLDLKEDTGEIPNLARLMRNPHVVVVRDPGPFDKLDREQTMRIEGPPPMGKTMTPEERAVYYEAYTHALKDLAGLGDGEDGPAEPVR